MTIIKSKNAAHQVIAIPKWHAKFGMAARGSTLHRVRRVKIYFNPSYFGEFDTGWSEKNAVIVYVDWECGITANNPLLLLSPWHRYAQSKTPRKRCLTCFK